MLVGQMALAWSFTERNRNPKIAAVETPTTPAAPTTMAGASDGAAGPGALSSGVDTRCGVTAMGSTAGTAASTSSSRGISTWTTSDGPGTATVTDHFFLLGADASTTCAPGSTGTGMPMDE